MPLRCRRGDGPDRVDQDRQGLHVRHAAGGAAPRPPPATTCCRAACRCATVARGRRMRAADGARRPGGLVRAGRLRHSVLLGRADVVLMRKDPPVDADYLHDTHILGLAAARRRAGGQRSAGPARLQREAGRAANSRSAARRPWSAATPPRCKAFVAEHGDAVLKPLDGMGGRSIFRVRAGDPNLNVILETLTGSGRHLAMAQRYLPEIARRRQAHPAGRRRAGGLLPGAHPAGRRVPRQPRRRRPRRRPPAERARPLDRRPGRPGDARRGMLFVGLDVIGDYLTEVNVTSPTCIRELDAQFGLNIAGTAVRRDRGEARGDERRRERDPAARRAGDPAARRIRASARTGASARPWCCRCCCTAC